MPIRVLIVLDGQFRFADMATPASSFHDFTYATLVSALADADMEVTKANRHADSTADMGMDNFNFASADLLAFDVIWLIGWDGRNDRDIPPDDAPSATEGMGAAALNKIAQFMEQGGGVFATGDHDSVGADMSGHIPRVRAMRRWFGRDDSARPSGVSALLANYPPMTSERADTTRPSPNSHYDEHPAPFVWFENQSDSVPQTLTPEGPTHPILRRAGHDITVFPDHMHEGTTLGDAPEFDYGQNSPYGDTSKPEFPHDERPRVIATGQVLANANYAAAGFGTDTTPAMARPINLLSVYDGRAVGVGRIVTGSTFHHYVDINLTGDSAIVAGPLADKVGEDAMNNQGFAYDDADEEVFKDIKAVFVNITTWLARPRPAIDLILERSTFSEAEVGATSAFEAAILLTVDGLKPSQFPGTGIPALGPIVGMPPWVPTIAVPIGVPIAIEPTFVSSDDPMMPDRLQRFTFTYRVHFTGDAFGFMEDTSTVPVEATLNSVAVSGALTSTAWIQLVRSANPFMLDLTDGNDKSWLSSDVKVFHVIAGDDFLGLATLAPNATRDQALMFIRAVANGISSDQFTNLPSAQADSTLSPLPMTTEMPIRRVYNFALARVRLSEAGPDAENVRVFFRMFTTQTTAALTYRLDGSDLPIEGYLRTDDADPIALPGTHFGGTLWLSFPFFAAARATPQHDTDNVKPIDADIGFKVFGALIDNNLPDPYLTETPLGGVVKSLPDLMMGEHQCLIAQVEYADAPIPNGAKPWTSDKLSQRNIAMSPVANPGLDGSRVAIHTFEIEATPHAIDETLPPDELLLGWSAHIPEGTVLRLHIPSWNAQQVVELADRFYPRHEIEAIDAHTVEIPGGGMRYLPIPRSQHRQTGVIAVEFPLGIQKGQRFDVSVRQITNRLRHARIPPPKIQEISLEEAEQMVPTATRDPLGLGRPAGRGVDLGGNRVLITDLSVFDAVSDRALIIEHPDPEEVKAAMGDAGRWREPIGAFQLGVPVSTRNEMLRYQMQLLSVMRWRTAHLPRKSRWRRTMLYYLDLLAAKVQALGGDPFSVPPTPDGAIPQPGGGGEGGEGGEGGGGSGSGDVGQAIELLIRKLLTGPGCWLLLILLLILLLVLLWYIFS
ncbi:MAG TPA: hypothetical protein VGW40_11385 [Allosphingosinicella sp.]|nr:hypothetical protein [Allosphingosinicella sp.]